MTGKKKTEEEHLVFFQEQVTSSALDPLFFQLASQRLAMAIMLLLATRLHAKAKSLREGLP